MKVTRLFTNVSLHLQKFCVPLPKLCVFSREKYCFTYKKELKLAFVLITETENCTKYSSFIPFIGLVSKICDTFIMPGVVDFMLCSFYYP